MVLLNSPKTFAKWQISDMHKFFQFERSKTLFYDINKWKTFCDALFVWCMHPCMYVHIFWTQFYFSSMFQLHASQVCRLNRDFIVILVKKEELSPKATIRGIKMLHLLTFSLTSTCMYIDNHNDLIKAATQT